jgi:hypothetical protein
MSHPARCSTLSPPIWAAGLRSALLVLLVALLGGCAAPPSAEEGTLIAPDLHFLTPAPRELGYSVSASQLVTARYRGDTYVFEAQLAVSPERLTMIGLDPFGRRALTITATDSAVTVDAAPGLPDGLRPANILADIAIVYWPEAAIRRGLAQSSAILQASARERSITLNGAELIRVDYDGVQNGVWPPSAHYMNIALGYELDLRSVAVRE